jgi:hypothetical protein
LAISFFFWSPAAFETFSKLLAHRSHMSACMNDKAFLSWSFFFDPLISGYFHFLLISSRIWNVGTTAAQWDPHVILYVQSSFFSWIILGSWYLVTCLFLSISCHVWNVEEPAGSWDPHVILYVLQKFIF